MKKTAKPKTQPWYRKHCVAIAKLIAKHRDHYTCQICGKNADQGYQIHASHIFPEGKYHSMSCEPDNLEALCARCHMDWHEHPLQAVERFRTRKQALHELLKARSLLSRKIDYKTQLEELKAEYNSIIN